MTLPGQRAGSLIPGFGKMDENSTAGENRMRGSGGRRGGAGAGVVKRLCALPGKAALAALISAAALMLCACGGNAAEAAVRADLDMLKASETAGSRLSSMRDILTKEEGEEFDAFLAKVRDFDYEITGSETRNDGDENYTGVRVRIRTRSFGREYLATWTDYLKEHKGASADDDLQGFYGELFGRLAGLTDRDYIRDVEIVAIDPLGNGEFVTNISSNEALQDALFGGMIGEMEALAGE